ncbi:MAG: sigma-54 dependent transcriptional regulator [Planctomycetota bacterium]
MKIAIVDDQVTVLDHVSRILEKLGHEVHGFSDADSARRFLAKSGDAVGSVVLDLDLGGGVHAGLDFLSEVRPLLPDKPIFILSGKGTIRLAVESLRRGATDFLEKDVNLSDYLEAAIHKAERLNAMLQTHKAVMRERDSLLIQASYFNEEVRRRYMLVGDSAALRKTLAEAQLAANLPRPVLIVGERGTGKELVAAFIHYASNRKDRPFITVNCAALTGNLLESEMFGHEKGAFTGAMDAKVGRFELADKGTLFLDEIGNMSLDFQKKMLRVIEYQRFERVQGTQTISVDVRIIAATNADLDAMIADGRFRPDLYDRLAFRVIQVPPLRERTEDIPALVRHFSDAIANEVPSLPRRRWTDEAVCKLATYAWPGNVRELRHLVERTFCSPGPLEIRPEEITFQRKPAERRAPPNDFESEILRAQTELIENALLEAGNNQKKASAALGLTYDQFRYYLKKVRTKAAGTD